MRDEEKQNNQVKLVFDEEGRELRDILEQMIQAMSLNEVKNEESLQ